MEEIIVASFLAFRGFIPRCHRQNIIMRNRYFPKGRRNSDKVSRASQKRQYFHDSSEVAWILVRWFGKRSGETPRNESGHPGGRREGGDRRGNACWKTAFLHLPRCVSSPMEDRRDLCSAVLFEFPKSRIPYTRDQATGEAAGVAEGLKRGVARPWHSDTLCCNMGARGRCSGSSQTESFEFIGQQSLEFCTRFLFRFHPFFFFNSFVWQIHDDIYRDIHRPQEVNKIVVNINGIALIKFHTHHYFIKTTTIF